MPDRPAEGDAFPPCPSRRRSLWRAGLLRSYAVCRVRRPPPRGESDAAPSPLDAGCRDTDENRCSRAAVTHGLCTAVADDCNGCSVCSDLQTALHTTHCKGGLVPVRCLTKVLRRLTVARERRAYEIPDLRRQGPWHFGHRGRRRAHSSRTRTASSFVAAKASLESGQCTPPRTSGLRNSSSTKIHNTPAQTTPDKKQ